MSCRLNLSRCMYTDACVKNSWRKSPRDDSCHLSGTHAYADSVMTDGECPPCVMQEHVLISVQEPLLSRAHILRQLNGNWPAT